jgi:hypothetical protein
MSTVPAKQGPSAVIRAELAGVERLRDAMRMLYGVATERSIYHAALYEHAVADLRCALLTDELNDQVAA